MKLIAILLLTVSMASVLPIPQDKANHGLLSGLEYYMLKPIVGTENASTITKVTMIVKELTDPIFSYEDIAYGMLGLIIAEGN